MSIKKLSLANAKQLSKAEMKKIMAGTSACNCNSKDDCSGSTPVCGNTGCVVSAGKQGECTTQ